ncbi:hypothetical protein cyc_00981 [Cyclospora cayetanensis]|uniref:Uncharacterized protein n=1 Tax=Cyclospora cayetanensis TaxID=88456 RepID=A0A1D3D974_9EIME|nr:hypothetical protein cyc_00981 [Cyclospora cayetanensis]
METEDFYDVVLEACEADFATGFSKVEDTHDALVSEKQKEFPFSCFKAFQSLLSSLVPHATPLDCLQLYRNVQQLAAWCTQEQQIIDAQGPPSAVPVRGALSRVLLRSAAANSGWFYSASLATTGLPSVPPVPSQAR